MRIGESTYLRNSWSFNFLLLIKYLGYLNNYLHSTKLTRDSKWILSSNLNHCTVRTKTFRDPVTAPSNICRSFRTQDFFSCRIFLGCCQIEFNWDFRMSYRPWVSDNLKSTVKVGREGSMSISDRKSKEAATLGSSDFLFFW